MSKYPYRDTVKVIRTIESCKTLEQLEGMANKMWWNLFRCHYEIVDIARIYNLKKEELTDESK